MLKVVGNFFYDSSPIPITFQVTYSMSVRTNKRQLVAFVNHPHIHYFYTRKTLYVPVNTTYNINE